jgi:biopolymer transport protein ExbD
MAGGGGGGATRGGRKKARIEIVPLIDIMFFLAAAFMLVSLTMNKNQGMNVQVPSASAAEKQDNKENKTLTLSINEKGEVFVNKDKVSIPALGIRLQAFKSAVKDPSVVVNADGRAEYKTVAAVIDEAKKIGVNKVALSTEKR